MSSLEAPIRHLGGAAAEDDEDVEELREEDCTDDLGCGGGGGFILPMPFSKWVNRSLSKYSQDLRLSFR